MGGCWRGATRWQVEEARLRTGRTWTAADGGAGSRSSSCWCRGDFPEVLQAGGAWRSMVVVVQPSQKVGKYEETIGTCYAFSESKTETMLMHQESGPSEVNLFENICIVDPKQGPSRQVKPVASLHKILKFRPATDDEVEMASSRHKTAD